MSYINDALRKAQTEKDSRYEHYRDIVFASAPLRTVTRKWPLFVLSFIAVLLMAVGGFYLYQSISLNPIVSRSLPTKSMSIPAKEAPVASAAPQGAVVTENNGQNMGQDLSDLYRTALAVQKGGQVAEAERMYRAILERQPAHSGALNNLGIIYMNQNRNAEAVRLFKEATAIKDGSADPHYNLACIYARMNDLSTSIQYLKTAVELNPMVKSWAREDKDLSNLKGSPEFKKITG
jgi:tetratricopeptide (TPR) repeat protein